MDILVIDPSDPEVNAATCDLCGDEMEFHFAHVEGVAGLGEEREIDICHDCLTGMMDAIEHETRSK